MKSLRLPNKINELKQIESILNQVSDMIIDKLKKMVQLQNNIKLDNLVYTTKSGKRYNFIKYFLRIVF